MSSHPLPMSSHPRTRADQQVNPVLHTIALPAADPSKKRESIRPLSTYDETQRRILGSRCYALRHIHQKNDVEVSAELNVRIEDLDALYCPANKIAWQVPDPHGLAEFRARQKQGLGPDDLV